MSKTIEAVYDGQVLRPEEPLDLQPNTRVRITIEPSSKARPKRQSFLRTASALNLEGPPDWSARIEEYLYGNQTDAQN